jgi:site-specific DNA recombinase
MTDAALASPDVTAAAAVAKAALYLRVSTGRQAESDLSIPDQRRQITVCCVDRGWHVAAEFVEPGNTATDDRRPAFQAMIVGCAREAADLHRYRRALLLALLPRSVPVRIL